MKFTEFEPGQLALLALGALGSVLVFLPVRAKQPKPDSTREVKATQLARDEGYEYPNLFDEAMPMIWISRLVYSFSYIVGEARKDENNLKIPDQIMNEYKNKRLDVRELNEGHGLSFKQIQDQFMGQVEELKRVKAVSPYDLTIIERLNEIEDAVEGDQFFLEVFDSIGMEYECVYGIFKDELRRRVTIAFRGSVTRNDWMMNLATQLVKMRTPGLMKDKWSDITVHRGFYEYIFDNARADGKQVYDKILNDIKPFVEDGYKLYVTGHSLGAALASILAFKLAGSEKEWIPKPITCISVESPFVGGYHFKRAFQELERGGMIRMLRITNTRSVVPAAPPFSLGLRNLGLYQHVGIHLRLSNRNEADISYPKKDGWSRLRRALANSLLKPIWFVLWYHKLELVDERMVINQEELRNVKINSIYESERIVGSMDP